MNSSSASVTCRLLMLAMVFTGAEQARASALYSVTDLGQDGPVTLYGLNDAGQVVGTVNSPPSTGHVKGYAFVYQGDSAGTVVPLGGSTDPTNYPAVRDSVPLAINNSGQVLAADLTGSVTGTRGDSFVYSNGQTTAIPSYASVLNDQGQVAGYTGNGAAATPSNPFDPRAYLYNVAAKTVQYLTATGTLPTEPLAINSAGQVAGILYPAVSSTPYVTHPFLYSDGKFVDLGTLGGKSAGALAINSQGDVVGGADTPNSQGHAFLYSKGTMKDLGTLPGGWSSFATSINNLGQVVGSSTSTEGPIGFRGSNGGFLYSNGVMQDLNELIAPGSGWDIISANQINNRGQILALGMNMDGSKYENLLLTPTGLPEPGNAVYPTIIPEPSSWIVFGLISVGLAVQQRHRRRNPASTCRQ